MPPGNIEGGEIVNHRNAETLDLKKLDQKGKKYRSIRGNEIVMIFQELMTSLNPVFTIENQIMEAITLPQDVGKKKAKSVAIQILEEVGIPLPEQRVDEYPHPLSGEMRQQAMIAMALSCNTTMLIADEPVSALDVSIQAQALNQLEDLQDEFCLTYLFIAHDLSVTIHINDRVAVMYLGQIVELSSVGKLFSYPKHPYTEALISVVPAANHDFESERIVLEGDVPSPVDPSSGYYFHPRYPYSESDCSEEEPEFREIEEDHYVHCR